MNRAEFLKLSALFPVVAKSVFGGIADDIADDISKDNIFLSDIDTIVISGKRNKTIVSGKVNLEIERNLIEVTGHGSSYDEYIQGMPEIQIECYVKNVKGNLRKFGRDLIDYEYTFEANLQKMSLTGKGYIAGLDDDYFMIHPSGAVTLNQ